MAEYNVRFGYLILHLLMWCSGLLTAFRGWLVDFLLATPNVQVSDPAG